MLPHIQHGHAAPGVARIDGDEADGSFSIQ
jgi:hypothetical protein